MFLSVFPAQVRYRFWVPPWLSPLPPPLPGLDVTTLSGTWRILATTLPFWRGRREVTVTYRTRPDGDWDDLLAFTRRGRRKTLGGRDTPHADRPGFFTWRGLGWLGWCRSTWGFVRVGPELSWAVTWFSRATLGVTPEGMDVYARDLLSREALDRIIADVTAEPGLPQTGPWYVIDEDA